MTSWQVGDVRITKILEMEYAARPEQLFPEARAEQVTAIEWLTPHYVDARGKLRFSIHALVLETPTRRIVVDTCVGNAKQGRDLPFWNGVETAFLEDLTTAGYPPESIDVVLCTHLHADHVGWNTRLVQGSWQPTFPNARYLIGARELGYWRTRSDLSEGLAMQADSLDPVFRAGLVDLIEPPHVICPEVSLVSSIGHTPGHVSVQIRSRGHEALITGDFIHHPCQFAHPEWASVADVDPGQASTTRAELLAASADAGALVLGTHFVEPSAGRVVRVAPGRYRFET
jgi:glyoxylase-like metal-dependent hydrolase (beta-lactamase superfamily II)